MCSREKFLNTGVLELVESVLGVMGRALVALVVGLEALVVRIWLMLVVENVVVDGIGKDLI